MEADLEPKSRLGSQILLFLQHREELPPQKRYKVKIGKKIKTFMRFKQLGITEDEPKIEEDSYASDGSDMAVEEGTKKNSNPAEIDQTGVKLTFDKEVLEILNERVNIKNMENNIQENVKEDESLSDMYSDIDDNEPLGPSTNTDLGNNNIEELIPNSNSNQKIEDLVNNIEKKRELEKLEKKKRDIKQANVEDYFTGFSSTITRKVENPKKIRSVMEEVIQKGDYLTEEQELAEIRRRMNQGTDNYTE
mmetsp:Transcript_23739/g.23644  ORF Transcript_23739/g.23644 Transcript_23739/m.23644 type:complete len:249 (+) Transcript_23739:1-747(+)